MAYRLQPSIRKGTVLNMLEQSTAFAATARDDAGYKSWQSSVNKVVMRLDPQGRTAGPIPTFGSMVHETAMAAQGLGNAYAPSPGMSAESKPDIAYETAAGNDSYTFDDIIDMINPLQHLPVIGTIYRKLTGDTIKGMSTIIGGTIFGGPIGAVASTANVIVKDRTGKDIADNALSMAGFGSSPAAPVRNNDIVYDVAEKDNLAATALYSRAAADGRKNFSAPRAAAFSWNA